MCENLAICPVSDCAAMTSPKFWSMGGGGWAAALSTHSWIRHWENDISLLASVTFCVVHKLVIVLSELWNVFSHERMCPACLRTYLRMTATFSRAEQQHFVAITVTFSLSVFHIFHVCFVIISFSFCHTLPSQTAVMCNLQSSPRPLVQLAWRRDGEWRYRRVEEGKGFEREFPAPACLHPPPSLALMEC